MSEAASVSSPIGSGEWVEAKLSALGLDGEQAVYAFKVMLAAGLTMFLAFLVDLPNTYWALLTLPLVVTPQSGMTVWRSASRVAGTLIGAAVVMVFIGLFAQNGLVMIACLAAWIFGCGYNARSQIGLDAYAYGTAGLTALVVAMDTGPNVDLAFSYAYWRTTETLVAVIASFAVLLTVFPRSVAADLRSSFDEARAKVVALLGDAVKPDEEQSARDRLAATTSLTELYTLLRAQRLERSHAGPDFVRAQTATSRLNRLFIETGSLSTIVAQARGRGILAGELEDRRTRLEDLASELPKASDDGEACARRAEDLRQYAERLDREDAMTTAVYGDGDERLAGLLTYRLRATALALAAFLQASLAFEDHRRPALPDVSFTTRYRDTSAAVQRGLRPACAFVVVALFWIFSAWSSGSILSLITGALSLLIPTILPRKLLATAGTKIFLGFCCGGVLAFLLMALLPSMHGFAGFLTLFLPTIFVIFYVCGGPNKPIALGATIMLAIALQPANEQTYDPVRLFNVVLTLAIMPAAFVSTMLIIVPENTAWLRRHLARAGTRQMKAAAFGRQRNLDSFLAQTVDVVADYGGDLDMEDYGDARLVDRAKAVAQAGQEMFEIERLRRTDHLSEDLASLVPRVRDIVVDATRMREGEDGARLRSRLEEVRAAASEGARALEAPSLAHTAALRFALAIHFLGSLVEQNRLALPERRTR